MPNFTCAPSVRASRYAVQSRRVRLAGSHIGDDESVRFPGVSRGFDQFASAIGGLLAVSGRALGVLAPRWSEPFDAVWWWFAVPLAVAATAAAALALWADRHPVLVEEPVVPVVRRTWKS